MTRIFFGLILSVAVLSAFSDTACAQRRTGGNNSRATMQRMAQMQQQYLEAQRQALARYQAAEQAKAAHKLELRKNAADAARRAKERQAAVSKSASSK